MDILNKVVFIAIAIFYNLLVHHITSSMYQELPYEEKLSKTVVFLFMAGIGAIVISLLILRDDQKFSDSVVSKGLALGGSLLIVTSIFANWENISDEARISLSAITFGGLIYYSRKYLDK
jgi:multisubunit Na+/H+ antiporter MnhB subunit